MSLINYWKIAHDPDTTETGLCTRVTYVKTVWVGFPAQKSCELEILEDFCYKKFGNRVDYVQGVAPTKSWYILTIDKEAYDLAAPNKFGGYSRQPQKIVLEIGNGKINELE